jgi:photosystem II stability/assembly factor-like uncharacterized protein
MARRKGPTPKRRVQHPQRRAKRETSRTLWFVLAAALVALAVVAAFAVFAGADDESGPGRAIGDPGPVHVHGLGINPRDRALFIATHTGLWRVAPGERRAERVTDDSQDTMGFTVVGPDLFLGSGHPDPREDLPPLLGLIESRDGGESWEPISLRGEADFHVLRSDGDRVYGFDVTNGRLMFSRDRGRTWRQEKPPGAVVDMAVDPSRSTHLLATGERGLVESADDGKTWRTVGDAVGLLAWPAPGALYLVDQAGAISRSGDGGKTWRAVGGIGGEPAALMATSERELYAALHDGTIKRSSDGGRTWTVRSTPA